MTVFPNIKPKNPALETRFFNRKRVVEYVSGSNEPLVGIFDVGTKAIRLLLAPRIVPEVWQEHSFCTISEPIGLGSDVKADEDILPLSSQKLDFVIFWIKLYTTALRNLGVTEVSAIGTAVFRWLDNQSEVLAAIEKGSGVKIAVISEAEEAELTLRSIPTILERRPGGPTVAEGDTVMALDQGGGSLEISWMKHRVGGAATDPLNVRLFDELGTEALKQMFFTTGGEDQLVAPDKNQTHIHRQMERIQNHARRIVTGWRGSPKASSEQEKRLHIFSLGTAITESVGGNSFEKHCRLITSERMASILSHREEKLAKTAEGAQVRSLHKQLVSLGSNRNTARKRQDLDNDLAILYGLPVYQRVLEKCGVSETYIWGYGLRHGHYVNEYLRKEPEPPFAPSEAANPVFVSYAHTDKAIVYPELVRLKEHGCELWYDHGIQPTAEWMTVLGEKVAASKAVLVFLTPASVISDSVKSEIVVAQNLKRPIVCVQLRPAVLPPAFQFLLSTKQIIRWSTNDEIYFNRVTKVLA